MHNPIRLPQQQRCALTVAILSLLASGSAAAATAGPGPVTSGGYTWTVPTTTFDTQNGYTGGNATVFSGINNAGNLVGSFNYASGSGAITGLSSNKSYGFINSSKVLVATGSGLNYGIASDYSNHGYNSVTGINNNGYAVGSFNTTSNNWSSYVSNNNFASKTPILDNNTNIEGSGLTVFNSSASGINDGASGSYGLVVGSNYLSNATADAFFYNNTGSTVAGIANGAYGDFVYAGTGANAASGTVSYTVFSGVNNSDLIVGNFSDNNGTHGLIFDPTTNTWLAVNDPNATAGTLLTGINNSGEAVGVYTDSNGTHGFTFNTTTDTFINAQIDSPNAVSGQSTVLLGVNDNGTLVGYYGTTPVGFTASVSTSAVPVPAAFWLMSSALAGLGLLRKRKA